MTKKNVIAVSACALAFAGLLIIATFFDLEISKAIGNANSVFGQFFNILGETPAWLGLPVGALILYQALVKENKFYKWLKPLLFVCILVGFYFFARYLMDEIVVELKWKWLYTGVFGLAMTLLSVLATNRVDKEIMNKLVIFAVLLLIAIAVSQGIVTVLKYIWSRQRFRNLQAGNITGGDTTGYTPWYKPTLGKHDENVLYPDTLGGKELSGAYRSFPSGHTAAAGVSFAVILIPEIFEKMKKYGVWFYAVPSVYTVIVAVSRIVNRAHYLSDVLIGGTIAVLSVFILKFVLKKFWIKYNFVGAETLKAVAAAEAAKEENADADSAETVAEKEETPASDEQTAEEGPFTEE